MKQLKKLNTRKTKLFYWERYLIGLTVLLLVAVAYLVGRLQNQPRVGVSETETPSVADITVTPTESPVEYETVINKPKPTAVPSPTITKEKVRIPVLISNVAYYCYEDMANSVSDKQSEIIKLKKELGICEFNFSQVKYQCDSSCRSDIEICRSNCMYSSSQTNTLEYCVDYCDKNAPACSCPNAVSCQSISGNLSKAQNDLSSLLRSNCP